MKFKKTPLFGQDSSPQNTSNILALCGTFLFWLIFVICMIFIKPNSQKPKYKEIQIILTQDFVAEKSDKNQESEKSQIQKTQESKLQNEQQQIQKQTAETDKIDKTVNAEQKQDIVKQPVQNENPKKQTQTRQNQQQRQKTENVSPPTQTEPIEYAKSVEDSWAEQLSQKSKKKQIDPDKIFLDDEVTNENEVPQTSVQKIPPEQPPFSDTAGTPTNPIQNPIQSQSRKDDFQKKTSGETSKLLENIENSNPADNSEKDKIQSQLEVSVSSDGDGHVKMQMQDGSTRVLLEPSEPAIFLSEDAASTIDSSRTVQIKFQIIKSGNVPSYQIQIMPASILSDTVKNEIIAQVSKWRFEQADSDAVAEFDYRIIKE